MDDLLQPLVGAIHDSGCGLAVVITGGGSGAIGELLQVPGASQSVIEAIVPYSTLALDSYLGFAPDQYCSVEAAAVLARRAWRRCVELDRSPRRHVGVAATASLTSNRPKHGPHRCHVATCDGELLRCYSVELVRDRRDRRGEEAVCVRLVLWATAIACGIAGRGFEIPLGADEPIAFEERPECEWFARLARGETSRVTISPDGRVRVGAAVPGVILAGSFNPLHAAHRGLAEVAATYARQPVSFELSIVNVDKQPLDSRAVADRVGQFRWHSAVEVTRAPTFLEKSRLFPSTLFVLGADTLIRLFDERYYASQVGGLDATFAEIASHGCRFLVAARPDESGRVWSIADVSIPSQWRPLFDAIPTDRLCSSESSSKIRERATSA